MNPMSLSGIYGYGSQVPLRGIGGTAAVGSDFDLSAVAPGSKPGRVDPSQCETCRKRKYKDGSDENDVSFQTAQHISPESAGARVRGHEQEHVANAYEKAAEKGGKVLQASVAIHTAICPECGRSYISGGLTTTKIAYPNEDNPYQKDRKSQQGDAVRGANLDLSV